MLNLLRLIVADVRRVDPEAASSWDLAGLLREQCAVRQLCLRAPLLAPFLVFCDGPRVARLFALVLRLDGGIATAILRIYAVGAACRGVAVADDSSC